MLIKMKYKIINLKLKNLRKNLKKEMKLKTI